MSFEQVRPDFMPSEAMLGQQGPKIVESEAGAPPLGKFALNLQTPDSTRALTESAEADVTSPFSPAFVESTGEDQAKIEPLDQQLNRLYSELFKPPLDVASQENLPSIALDQIPALRAKFQELGIPGKLAENMYESWATFRGLDAVKKETGKATLSDLTPYELQQAVERQTYSTKRQVRALEGHVKQYGLNEVLELHRIFNTTKFAIYEPGQLHNQLLRWKRGDRINDVGVIAQADVSNKLNAGDLLAGLRRKWMYTFLRSQPPIFEVKDKTELAKVAISVGQHERAAGREPDIKNFMIYGHGGVSMEGGHVKLGREAWITTNDYVAAAERRERARRPETPRTIDQYRINDYTKHLGPNFETILVACNGGEKLPGGKASLTEAMHHGHNLSITGAKGSFTLFRRLWNGKIHFYTLSGADAQPRSFRRKRVRQ